MDSAEATTPPNSGHCETLPWIIRNRGCADTRLRFSSRPVEQSSITTTTLPSASRRSTKCEPMNPAPPVTRTCGGTELMRGECCVLRVAWSKALFRATRSTQHAMLFSGPSLSPPWPWLFTAADCRGGRGFAGEIHRHAGILQQGLGQRFGHSLAVGGIRDASGLFAIGQKSAFHEQRGAVLPLQDPQEPRATDAAIR